jgi:hypothetical protein
MTTTRGSLKGNAGRAGIGCKATSTGRNTTVRCVRAMPMAQPPQRTATDRLLQHPTTPFVERPALASMYTALGLTSLDHGHLQSEAALRWARETHGLVEAGSLASSSLTSRVDGTSQQQRTDTLLRARPHARAPAHRLRPRSGARAAQRLAELVPGAQRLKTRSACAKCCRGSCRLSP